MAKVFYDKDCDLSLLKGKVIGVIGFGSQGHAHAMNLRDSGFNVIIGSAEGRPSWKAAKEAGFDVMTNREVAKKADIIVILLADNVMPRIFDEEVKPELGSGKTLLFAHGFNVHYGQVVPPKGIDVIMVAPKCPGHIMRRLYTENAGPPAIAAVYENATGKAFDIALAYASGVGCARAGVIETTFTEETETDLFGEQAVLCGGVTALIKASFETLVEAGYQPEIAYFECLNELKLIVDLIYQGGLTYMRYSVSDVAEYGDLTRGPRIINEDVRKTLKVILKEVQDGTFARDWVLENQANRPAYNTLKRIDNESLLEQVGARLRAMMPWTKEGQ